MEKLRAARAGQGVRADFIVRNMGKVAGKAVPQVYLAGAGWEAPKRLGGFASVTLAPGEVRSISVTIDPRLFATFDEATRH